MSAPTTKDVLDRMLAKLESGEGDPEPCRYGKWCIGCIGGGAKTELDTERGTAAPILDVIADLGAETVLPGDAPLIEARDLVMWACGNKWPASFTQAGSIALVNAALARLAATTP